MSPLSILFVGDVVGSLGRTALAQLLSQLRQELHLDLVIANGENAAHGKGITIATAETLLQAGVDIITTGDHAFDQSRDIESCFNGTLPIIRPANYHRNAPGKGYMTISTPKGEVLVINVVGQVFMNQPFNSPFEIWSEITPLFTDKKFSAIIIDIHAEATAEKVAFRHLVDGKISALLGTHTHIQTADAHISPHHTGYITDVGMTGYADGIIGIAAEPVLKTFLTNIKHGHELPESGAAILNAVHLQIDPLTQHCIAITPLQRSITIS